MERKGEGGEGEGEETSRKERVNIKSDCLKEKQGLRVHSDICPQANL